MPRWTAMDPHEPGNSLCWSCRNATPLMCEWVKSAITGHIPEHITSYGQKAVTRQSGKENRLTGKVAVRIITGCKRHEPGPLPPMGQRHAE